MGGVGHEAGNQVEIQMPTLDEDSTLVNRATKGTCSDRLGSTSNGGCSGTRGRARYQNTRSEVVSASRECQRQVSRLGTDTRTGGTVTPEARMQTAKWDTDRPTIHPGWGDGQTREKTTGTSRTPPSPHPAKKKDGQREMRALTT